MTKEAISKAPAGRTKRTPIGASKNGRLTVHDQDPNYKYRWVNVRDDRIQQFLDAGYEVCPRKVPVGTDTVDNPSSMGSENSISVGLGDRAVLMRQPKEYAEEDFKAKQARVDATEQSIKDKVRNTHGGRFERDTDPLA